MVLGGGWSIKSKTTVNEDHNIEKDSWIFCEMGQYSSELKNVKKLKIVDVKINGISIYYHLQTVNNEIPVNRFQLPKVKHSGGEIINFVSLED